MGKFARKLGYILAIGATLALFIYGFYILVPKITPYLTRPVSLILMIGLGGILLIILGLIVERFNEDR